MLDALDLKDIHYGMWVKVKYEGEIFLGKVLSEVNNQTQVRCLKLPFGILGPQEFEREEDAVFYETVYGTSVNPVMVKEDAVSYETVYGTSVNPVMVKNGKKWAWRY